MSGKALQAKFNFTGRRISKEEFWNLIEELENKATEYDIPLYEVKPYANKKDHGDIDTVTHVEFVDQFLNANETREDFVKKVFGAQFVSKNSFVYSFDYKGVQIDLAMLPENKICPYIYFCNYSPLGNIYGKSLKEVGLTWGMDGLRYKVYHDEQNIGEVLISDLNSMSKVNNMLKFGGLDINQYGKFQEESDIFDFVVQSHFFNKSSFAFDNLNSETRGRDSKRADYLRWMEYIKDKPDKFAISSNKSDYLSEISTYFKVPLYEKINDLVARYEWNKNISSKFNGHVVNQLTGYTGASLGNFICQFKRQICENDTEKLRHWVSIHTEDQIRAEILKFNETF